MITLKINGMIELDPEQLPGFLVEKIKQDLTLDNPAYVNAERLGFWTGDLDKEIILYRQEGKNMILPRGYGAELVKLLLKRSISYRLADRRVTLPPVEFNARIKLRDYQKPAVERLVRMRQGGIAAPCGSGKTEMLLECMARIRQPALWICHTYELLNQTRERACEAFGMAPDEIGIIAGGQVNVGEKLTLALIQTLRDANLEELAGRFGAIFIDEAHHLAAQTFFDTVNAFPALYRLWASATPTRQDGLTTMVFAAGGPVVHEIGLQDLPVITPCLEVIETEYRWHNDNYTKLISDLIRDEQRNRLLVDTILAEAPGNYCLVLSDRIEHLHTLAAMLKEAAPDMRIETLTGKGVSKKKRAEIMEQALEKEVDVLLATQLAREGLDLPHLNRLFLCTPKRAGGAVQQEVGRIMRPAPGKQDAIAFDFWDTGSPFLKAQFWRRREVYWKLGMAVDIKRKTCLAQAR